MERPWFLNLLLQSLITGFLLTQLRTLLTKTDTVWPYHVSVIHNWLLVNAGNQTANKTMAACPYHVSVIHKWLLANTANQTADKTDTACPYLVSVFYNWLLAR